MAEVHVPLGGDDWAKIKDVSDLRAGDRREVNKKIIIEATPDGRPIIRQSMEDDMVSAILEHVVLNWSLQMPLPAVDPYRPASADGKVPENPGSLSKLTLGQDNALLEAVKPHYLALTGQDAPTKENETPTPASAS